MTLAVTIIPNLLQTCKQKIHPSWFLPVYKISGVLTLECYLTLQNKCSNLGKEKFPLNIGSSSVFASVHLCCNNFTTAVDSIFFVCFIFFTPAQFSFHSIFRTNSDKDESSFHVFSQHAKLLWQLEYLVVVVMTSKVFSNEMSVKLKLSNKRKTKANL